MSRSRILLHSISSHHVQKRHILKKKKQEKVLVIFLWSELSALLTHLLIILLWFGFCGIKKYSKRFSSTFQQCIPMRVSTTRSPLKFFEDDNLKN